GFTRFYIFGPDHKLSPVAVLDSEGPKGPPTLCTTCHAGRWAGPGADADVGSIFREFEPSLLQRRTGIAATTAEKEWYALNKAILRPNEPLRTGAEGCPSDLNKGRDSIAPYVDQELYSKRSPPVSRDVHDAFHIPPSWQTGADPNLVAAKAAMYTKVVNV